MKFFRRKKREKQVHTQKASKSDYMICLTKIAISTVLLIPSFSDSGMFFLTT